MWPLPVSAQTLVRVAVVLSAFAAGFWSAWQARTLTIAEMRLKQQAALLSGYRAAESANRRAAEQYASDLRNLRDRPPRVVRICPDGVPAPAGGSGSAPGPGADPGDGEDITPVLTGCLAELYRYRALSDAISARQ